MVQRQPKDGDAIKNQEGDEELRLKLQQASMQLAKLDRRYQQATQELINMGLAQGNLYRFQEKIEQQKTIYAQIADVGHRFNQSLDPQEVFEAVSRFCIDLLNFEKFALLLPSSENGFLEIKIHGGFEGAEVVAKGFPVKIPIEEKDLAVLLDARTKWLVGSSESAVGSYWRRVFRVDEFCIYSMGVADGGLRGLLLIGNSSENAEYHRKIEDDAELDALFSNVTSLVAGALTTVKFMQAIQSESAQVHRLLNSMKQSVFLVDGSANIIGPVSRFSESIFGQSIVGQSVFASVFKDLPEGSETRSRIESVFATAFGESELQWMLMSDHLPTRFRYRRPGEDESALRVLRSTVQPIWDEAENLEKIMFVIEDTTELEELEGRIAKERTEIEIIQQILRNDREGVRDFFAKSIRLLATSKHSLGSDPVSAEGFGTLMRALHTLKGNARLLGFSHVSKAVHDVESKILALKSQLVSSQNAKSCAARVQALELLVDVLTALYMQTEVAKNVFSINSDIRGFLTEFQKESIQLKVPRNDFLKKAILVMRLLQLTSPEQERSWFDTYLHQWIETDKWVGREGDLATEQPIQKVIDRAMRISFATDRSDAGTERGIVEVNEADLLRLQKSIESGIRAPDDEIQWQEVVRSFRRLTEVPVLPFLRNFASMVSEVSASLGKSVSLSVGGNDLSVPRSELSDIQDIVVQLVRNAIDHGIETPDERVRLGKAEAGLIEISCMEKKAIIELRLKDNGSGIDPDVLVRLAVEKNLIAQAVAQTLSVEQKIDLIFLPGFSSKSQASDLSGRGVGMDIVKSIIDRRNGKIEVASEISKGTEFRIEIPIQSRSGP